MSKPRSSQLTTFAKAITLLFLCFLVFFFTRCFLGSLTFVEVPHWRPLPDTGLFTLVGVTLFLVGVTIFGIALKLKQSWLETQSRKWQIATKCSVWFEPKGYAWKGCCLDDAHKTMPKCWWLQTYILVHTYIWGRRGMEQVEKVEGGRREEKGRGRRGWWGRMEVTESNEKRWVYKHLCNWIVIIAGKGVKCKDQQLKVLSLQ